MRIELTDADDVRGVRPFGAGPRRCPGEHLARAVLSATETEEARRVRRPV